LGIIRLIINALTGDVANKLADAYKARHDARTEQDRIMADVQIAQLEANQANRALGGRITAFVQAAWALPFIIYTWKLVFFDKVLGMGATDPLSPALLDMQTTIVALYFGGAAGIGIVRALRK
jgi:hypothetical protein